MYERFTDRARRVMMLANQEAQRFNHEYIGTEHILLGLVKEGSGVGARALKNLGVDLQKARREVEKLMKSGPEGMPSMGRLPQTSQAKKVLEYAFEESRNLGHNYVDTEHLLLGLLREQNGTVAAQVLLVSLGVVQLYRVREEVLHLLDRDDRDENGDDQSVQRERTTVSCQSENLSPGSYDVHAVFSVDISAQKCSVYAVISLVGGPRSTSFFHVVELSRKICPNLPNPSAPDFPIGTLRIVQEGQFLVPFFEPNPPTSDTTRAP